MSRIFGEDLKKNHMTLFELLRVLKVEARNFHQIVEYNEKLIW